jgi:hypothetical protein
MSGNTNNRFLLNLYSSDLGGLTFEGEFETYEAALERVKGWVMCGHDDEEAVEAERVAGMWLIEEEVGPRMEYHVQLMALYRDRNFSCTQESEKIHPSFKGVLFKDFRTLSEAKTRIAQAKRKAEEDNAYDLKYRYRQDVELADKMKAAGLSYVDPVPHFPIKSWSEAIKPQLHSEITLEELKAIQFPEPGFMGISKPGEFQVTSDALRVTDPCYSMETWCAGTLEGVANGKWFAQAGHCHDETDCQWRKKHFLEEVEKIEKAMTLVEPDGEPDKWLADYMKRDLLKMGNPMTAGGRVCFMHIRHESVPADEPIDPSKFTKSDIHVGVDSGQAGFFDLKPFEAVAALPNHAEDKKPDHPHHEFYGQCCNTTCETEESWGIIQGIGVVSSTGWGDGGYDCFVRRNEAGLVIEARITYLLPGNDGFISAEDEDEEGDEE